MARLLPRKSPSCNLINSVWDWECPCLPTFPPTLGLIRLPIREVRSNIRKHTDRVLLCITQHFSLDKHNVRVPTENVLDKNSIHTDSELQLQGYQLMLFSVVQIMTLNTILQKHNKKSPERKERKKEIQRMQNKEFKEGKEWSFKDKMETGWRNTLQGGSQFWTLQSPWGNNRCNTLLNLKGTTGL